MDFFVVVGTFHFIGIYSQLAASVNLVLEGHDENMSHSVG